jgi:hypothetical protein
VLRTVVGRGCYRIEMGYAAILDGTRHKTTGRPFVGRASASVGESVIAAANRFVVEEQMDPPPVQLL